MDNISDSFHIMVLGSGHVDDPGLPSVMDLGDAGLSRLTEGLRLFGLIKRAKLVFSGYGGKSGISHAEIQRQASIEMGVNQSKISIIPTAENTWQEATKYHKKFGSETKLILVTSAMHMSRAVYLFQKKGLDPIPAPCNFKVKDDPTDRNWGISVSAENMLILRLALHEYLGMWYAKFKY